MPSSARAARRIYSLLFLAMMSMAMGQTLVFAFLPLLGRAVGLAELQVGLIIAASSAVYAASTGPWGRRSDRWGRRRTMIWGLSGYTVGTLVFASLFWFGLEGALRGLLLWVCLIVARCLQSTVMAATSPAASAYVSDITTPATRTVGIARLSAANNVGTILGPALGGALAAISLLLPLYFAAGMTLLTVLAIWLWLPESPRHQGASPAATPFKLGFNDARYRVFLLIGVVMLTAFSVIQQTLAFYFQDILQLSSQAVAGRVGLALMFAASTALAAQLLLVQRLQWPPLRLVFWGLLGLCLGSGLLALADGSLLLFLGMAVAGLGLGLCYPGVVAAATLTVGSEEQGSLAGLTTAIPALGSIVGPVLGTGLYQLNWHLPYALNVLILLPMLVLSWRLLRATKKVDKQS